MAQNVSNRPEFDLSAKLGPDSRWTKIGAGWRRDDGSISLKLDDFVMLGGLNKPDALYLFVRKDKEEEK